MDRAKEKEYIKKLAHICYETSMPAALAYDYSEQDNCWFYTVMVDYTRTFSFSEAEYEKAQEITDEINNYAKSLKDTLPLPY